MEKLIEFFCDYYIIIAPILFMLGSAISRILWYKYVADEEEPKIYITDKDGNIIEVEEK